MKCCDKAVTRFILNQAYYMSGEAGGRDFAYDMLQGAGISLSNPDDRALINEMSKEQIERITELLSSDGEDDYE